MEYQTMKSKIALALLAVTLAGTASAEMSVEDAMKFRQSGYTFMKWNMGKLKGMLVDNPASFNKDQAMAAAKAIQGVANSGMGALYIPGSDKGKGFFATRVKPELFTDKAGVAKVAKTFNMEANELARVSESGDAAAIKAQFGKLGAACKGCHDDYKTKED
jgi:cytochrome c556